MPGSVLTIDIEERDGIHLVRVSGPLDSVTHDQFRDYLEPLIAKPHARIVLDCENLTYVNSRGIMLLARTQRTMSSSMAFFGVAALHARILKAIELLGMGKLLHLYPTVEEGLAAAAKL